MILTLILIILVVACATSVAYAECKPGHRYVTRFLKMFVGYFIASAILPGLPIAFVALIINAITIWFFVPEAIIEEDIAPLLPIQVKEHEPDVFVLGQGTKESAAYYMIFARNPNGSISTHIVLEHPGLKFIESDEMIDKGLWKGTARVKDYSGFLDYFLWFKPEDAEPLAFTIIVPKGSISYSFIQ